MPIHGLWSRTEFRSQTSKRLKPRSRSLKALDAAIQTAHGAAPGAEQMAGLLAVRKAIYDWKVDNAGRAARNNKPRDWRGSCRAPGIAALEAQAIVILHRDHPRYPQIQASMRQKVGRAAAKLRAITGADDKTPRLPGRTKPLSNLDYFLEFVDPKHRAEASSSMNYWKGATPVPGHEALDFSQSYPDFMRDLEALDAQFVKAGFDARGGELPDEGYGTLKHVYYVPSDELPHYELRNALGGNAKWSRSMDGFAPFHSGDHCSEPGKNGWSIFVMDQQNRIYTHSKVVKQFHHSSFLGGRPAKSAGTLCVDHGRILAVTMASGHYSPGPKQAVAVCLALLAKLAADPRAEMQAAMSAMMRGAKAPGPSKQIDANSRRNSERARAELARIKICPSFNYQSWYNALKYLEAVGEVGGLQPMAAPAQLMPS